MAKKLKKGKAEKKSKQAEVSVEDALALQVQPDKPGFKEKVTPKKPGEGLFFFKCSCGGSHYRHAGYMQIMLPFLKSGGEKQIAMKEERVMVCVACRKCYVWDGEQMYDVTDKIDLKAWEKAEKEAYRATGPGGDC